VDTTPHRPMAGHRRTPAGGGLDRRPDRDLPARDPTTGSTCCSSSSPSSGYAAARPSDSGGATSTSTPAT
jgi:hypothetical protein